MTPPQSRTAHELARMLLDREASGGDTPATVAAATERVCRDVSEYLSRWVGTDGTGALFARALASAQAEHPALGNVRYSHHSAVCLDGVAESAQTHGAGAAADGVTAILTALIELLGRLIGDDIAIRLVEQSMPTQTPDDERATRGEDAR